MVFGDSRFSGTHQRPHIRLEVSPALSESCVDAQTFLSIMGALPTGVAVVTTLADGNRPIGLTCSAMCSLSKQPPLLLVSIHRHSRVLKAILECDRFLVNVLREERESTSSLFASAHADRFATVVWHPSPMSGLPWMFEDTIAYAECQVIGAVEVGDHTMVVGVIVDGDASQDAFRPLMYWRRQYGRWLDEEDPFASALTVATEG